MTLLIKDGTLVPHLFYPVGFILKTMWSLGMPGKHW